MAEKTGIAWCDHTFNPWIGCTKVSPGCDSCYAEALDKRHRWKGATHWGAGVPRMRTSPSNWEQPLKWDRKAKTVGARRLVFCASLADVFDNEVPLRWRQDLLDLIAATPNLTWLLLTKRIGVAARMLYAAGCHSSFYLTSDDHYKAPPNLWLGASVVNQEEADRDIPKLLATPAAKRFVSYEPALGPIDFSTHLGMAPNHEDLRGLLNWIIVGGESSQGGVKARPFDRGWARMTIAQCAAAGVPCLVKQLGSTVQAENGPGGCDVFAPRFRDRAGADPSEWSEDLRVQEFPA